MPSDAAHLHQAVAGHLNEAFLGGEAGAMARRLLAALNWALPVVGHRTDSLRRARQAAAAFRRRAPMGSMLPLPEGMVFAIVAVMMAVLVVLVACPAYLKLGELERVSWSMVHPPSAATGGPMWTGRRQS